MVVDDLDVTCRSTELLDNAAYCIELTAVYRGRHDKLRRLTSRHGGDNAVTLDLYERWRVTADRAAKHFLAELEHRLKLPNTGSPVYRLSQIEVKMGMTANAGTGSRLFPLIREIVYPPKQPFDAWVLDHVAQLNADNPEHVQQALVLLGAVEKYHEVSCAGSISKRIEVLREML